LYFHQQITSPLRPLLGSALVSKLKQKIQEKIQAAVYAVDEEKRINEGGSDNVINTDTCIEVSHPFNKGGSNVKQLRVTQSKLRQKFYQCKSCAKIFFCKITLRIHKNHCRGLQKQYHCSSCPLMFKSRTVLFNHRQLHSANKSKCRHKCEMCGREFILKSTLKKHRQSQVCKGSRMKFYRKLPQHFCSQCGEGFLNSSNLELHQKLHKVGETRSSNNAVEGTCSDSRGASVHIPRAVRRYPCSYCDEAFIDRRSVALHEKLHTDKEFATFDEKRKMILRRHQLTVMFQRQQQQQQGNRKRFGCDVCGRCYSIELLLHMHTRLHHAIS
jgi:ribosomal protein L31